MIGLPRELAVETRAYPMGASEGFEGLGGAWMTHGLGGTPRIQRPPGPSQEVPRFEAHLEARHLTLSSRGPPQPGRGLYSYGPGVRFSGNSRVRRP